MLGLGRADQQLQSILKTLYKLRAFRLDEIGKVKRIERNIVFKTMAICEIAPPLVLF